MNRVSQYLLSILAGALLVSISNTLVKKKGALSSILKLITGVTLTMLIVSPWTGITIDTVGYSLSEIEAEAAIVVENGKQVAQNEISIYIKEQTEAYILDKAFDLGLDISVDVTLTEEMPPEIASVSVKGFASPFAQKQIMILICEDLGVTEECLVWSQSNG